MPTWHDDSPDCARRESTPERVVMFSARHKAEAVVSPASDGSGAWRVEFPKGPPASELARSFSVIEGPAGPFQATGEAALGRLLRRAAELAMSLPNHAADLYAEEVAKIEAEPPSTTEALRLTKQRVGQNLFRKALMEYLGSACAVTGLHLPELLRASHAKPWADCISDAERLDVFNGFLLSAQLDALFDSGLITFDDEGVLQPSPPLNPFHRMLLGLSDETSLHLRWISPQHLPYLAWHRQHVFQSWSPMNTTDITLTWNGSQWDCSAAGLKSPLPPGTTIQLRIRPPMLPSPL